MTRTTNFALLFCACLIASSFHSEIVQADSATELVNITNFDDQEYEFRFSTSAVVTSIDSIVVEMSHDNVEQVQIFLENVGGGGPYVFSTLVNGFGSGTGNRIGVADGNLSDLVGLAELTFVETGAPTTVRGFAADPVPTGTYLAEDWEAFGSPGPYDPTEFRLVIRDNSVAFSEMGAIGRVTVNFTTAVPEPSSLGLIALGAIGMIVRRRK